MTNDERALREKIIDTCLGLEVAGLNQGRSGNISTRMGPKGFLITPSGVSYDEMVPEDIVSVDLESGECVGKRRPSSELPFHLAIMRARADADVVVHTHSEHATAIACLRKNLPAVHYTVAMFGGSDIRCAPYATIGTEELSAHVLTALDDRRGALMANHGLVVLGRDLDQAFELVREAETIAKIYLHAMAAGEPVLVPADEMNRIVERFCDFGYGPLR
jgi:L-fuculose-phosphate aldolase